jgi:Fe(3+) dicitrate transport protein
LITPLLSCPASRWFDRCHVNENPAQSNRFRNWFAVDWNLFALKLEHKFNNDADFPYNYLIDASRKASVIVLTVFRVQIQKGSVRDLIVGDFVNWGRSQILALLYRRK